MSAKIHVGGGITCYANKMLSLTGWSAASIGAGWHPPATASLLDVIMSYDTLLVTLRNNMWSVFGDLSHFSLDANGKVGESYTLSNPVDLSPFNTLVYDETYYAFPCMVFRRSLVC